MLQDTGRGKSLGGNFVLGVDIGGTFEVGKLFGIVVDWELGVPVGRSFLVQAVA